MSLAVRRRVSRKQLAAFVADLAVTLQEVAEDRRDHPTGHQYERGKDQEHDDDRDRSGHVRTIAAARQ